MIKGISSLVIFIKISEHVVKNKYILYIMLMLIKLYIFNLCITQINQIWNFRKLEYKKIAGRFIFQVFESYTSNTKDDELYLIFIIHEILVCILMWPISVTKYKKEKKD